MCVYINIYIYIYIYIYMCVCVCVCASFLLYTGWGGAPALRISRKKGSF